MSASPERALAAALRTQAAADAGVAAILGNRLYDDRPAEPVYPFLTLGRVETRPAAPDALEHAITLHVWSRYGGRAEALDAIGALRAALDGADLPMPGRRLVLLIATFADVFRAGDGRTTHGVLRLKAITEAA